ncbi:hypothetical protein K493DRAFT_388414 [Basidiobolus meristosporus CBS 931.73]|uniref:F-box domain-containing protein n=1 Tax=Basidiobolus meristosporus CBS 931.73 TaxID=1314790 RepID=A0A1Y1XAU5_9FUNG|nr:hypothetical protein K493DRAFT_388414 [Basidiobolus meristosporus CBS 931.73]|eukprot:ORX82849.1 hypothetical protein K493DRAFT_388414 [Basidiobolus meristosporus CBS 931.73]
MSRLAELPEDLLLHQLRYFSAKGLARLSVTNKYFNKICMDDSLWHNVCRSYGVTELGNWPGKTFKSLYYLLLSKWGWLLGLWFGNFPTIGDLVQVVWVPEEGALVASRIECINTYNMRMEQLLPVNPNVLIYELHTSFKYRRLFVISLDATTSDITTLCHYPDLLIRLDDDTWVPMDNRTGIDLRQCHRANVSKVSFYSHPKTGLWVSLPEQWELDYTNQDSPQMSKRPCFSWRCSRHCHECSRFQVRMFVPSLAKLFPFEVNPSASSPLQGLWVGTYGPHGCEILLFNYDEQGSQLLASKITGDINVPRGEITFLVDFGRELVDASNVLFRGYRVYAGQGQIASNSFLNSRMIDIECMHRFPCRMIGILIRFIRIGIWISNDEIAVYWCDLHLLGRYLRVTDNQSRFVSRISTPLAH